MIDKLERRFGHFAIPNVTLMVIVLQIATFVALKRSPELADRLLLMTAQVFAGEAYRLLTFLLVPLVDNPVFAFFFWYLF